LKDPDGGSWMRGNWSAVKSRNPDNIVKSLDFIDAT
jgi:hypothetical protein